MSLDPGLVPVVIASTALVALLAGVVIGRRTGRGHARIQELQARLESLAKENDLARAAAESARGETARMRSELEAYREDVVEHFTGTSGLLRDLTHQYRAVYEHLTAGATTLCPEGSIDLLESLTRERLPDAVGDPDLELEVDEPSEGDDRLQAND